jgi:stage II sporulation protein P
LRHHILSGAVIAGFLCSAGNPVLADSSVQPLPAVSVDTKTDSLKTNEEQDVIVNIVDITNLRKGPSTEAAIIGKAQPGQSYAVVASEGDWYRIALSGGNVAYVASWVVETTKKQSTSAGGSGQTIPSNGAQAVPSSNGQAASTNNGQTAPADSGQATPSSTQQTDSSGSGQKLTIHITGVTNLRQQPSLDAKIIGKAQPGQTYAVAASEGDWYRIALPDGVAAYVANWVVTAVSDAETQQNSASKVFIYHTHNRESWKNVASQTAGSSIDDPKINITLAGQELGRVLQEKGVSSIVSNDDFASRLIKQNLGFSQSYAESRKAIDQARKTAPGLTYFFDIHRDADVPRSKTTVTIKGKTYARILFVIGTANPNNKENGKFAEELNKLLEKKYPGLSRGVLIKDAHQGNGEYNQSISPGSLLMEFGGANNTLEENLRTAGAFADVFAEYYAGKEGKTPAR